MDGKICVYCKYISGRRMMHRLALACQARNVMINKCKPYWRIVAGYSNYLPITT